MRQVSLALSALRAVDGLGAVEEWNVAKQRPLLLSLQLAAPHLGQPRPQTERSVVSDCRLTAGMVRAVHCRGDLQHFRHGATGAQNVGHRSRSTERSAKSR